jgi:hypothetical protein
MDSEEWQEGFLGGLELGFATAECILNANGGIADIRRERAKVKGLIDKNRGAGDGREMQTTDIYEPMAVAHPADFGMPWTGADEKIAKESRVKMSERNPSTRSNRSFTKSNCCQ